LITVSLSDIITPWIRNTVKRSKPFLRSQNGPILPGEMWKLCFSVYVLKFRKAAAHEYALLSKVFGLYFIAPTPVKRPIKELSSRFVGFWKQQE
jgi:hypothetical protein